MITTDKTLRLAEMRVNNLAGQRGGGICGGMAHVNRLSDEMLFGSPTIKAPERVVLHCLEEKVLIMLVFAWRHVRGEMGEQTKNAKGVGNG